MAKPALRPTWMHLFTPRRPSSQSEKAAPVIRAMNTWKGSWQGLHYTSPPCYLQTLVKLEGRFNINEPPNNGVNLSARGTPSQSPCIRSRAAGYAER